MEFFSVLSVLFGFFTPQINTAGEFYNEDMLWIAFVIAGVIWLTVHALKSVGLYTMAKKRGMSKKLLWCAFVPFANTFLMGELGGKLGRNFKHVGLYAMIGEFLFCGACAAYFGMVAHVYMNGLYADTPVPNVVTQNGVELTYYSFDYLISEQAVRVINAFYYIQYIFSFITPVVCILVYIVFFRRYAPSSYIWMTVLCALISLAVGPLVFAYRKRTPVDYEAFMRARYEQIRRRQQQYYQQQNPYGQPPYGQGQYGAPYGQPPQGQYGAPDGQQGQPQNGDDDPFGEFSAGGQSPYGSSKGGDGAGGSSGQGGAGGNSGQNGSGGQDDGFFS